MKTKRIKVTKYNIGKVYEKMNKFFKSIEGDGQEYESNTLFGPSVLYKPYSFNKAVMTLTDHCISLEYPMRTSVKLGDYVYFSRTHMITKNVWKQFDGHIGVFFHMYRKAAKELRYDVICKED